MTPGFEAPPQISSSLPKRNKDRLHDRCRAGKSKPKGKMGEAPEEDGDQKSQQHRGRYK